MLRNINSASVSFKYAPPAVSGPSAIHYATPEEDLMSFSPLYHHDVYLQRNRLAGLKGKTFSPKNVSDTIFDVASVAVLCASATVSGFFGLKIYKHLKK